MFGKEGHTESGSIKIIFGPNLTPIAFFAFTISAILSVTIKGIYLYHFHLFSALIL